MASSLNAATSGGGGVITTADASGDLNIQSGGSTVVAVTSAGVAVTGTLSSSGASTFTGTGKFATTIGVGNATPAASGSGITFPASQSASSDANTLDDYEEGTWTPSDASGAGLSFTSVSGSYTKIGRLVAVQAKFSYPVTASSATASIGGLPFTVGFDTVGCQKNNNGLAAVTLSSASSTTIQINIFATGGNATNAQCTSGTFILNMTYYV